MIEQLRNWRCRIFHLVVVRPVADQQLQICVTCQRTILRERGVRSERENKRGGADKTLANFGHLYVTASSSSSYLNAF
jgi:hypothetical protein